MAAPEHRPHWVRVDRLLGEHGIAADTAAGRKQFEQYMERRRLEAGQDAPWKPLLRGWFLGSEKFRSQLLERMEPRLGEHHSGRLRHESAQARGERIIAEELKRREWQQGDLARRRKGDADKLTIAARLRRETTLTIREIAQRLHTGSWKSLNNRLYLAKKRLAKQRNANEK